MKKSKKPESFLNKTYYPGGNKAMDEFIKGELKYPKEAFEKKIEGYVVVKVDINMDGKVIQSHIEKGLGHGCDEEALRLVKLLKFEPVKLRNMKATFHHTINIHFKLKDIKLPEKGGILYNYIEKKPGKTTEKPKEKTTYTYKIEWN
jgi:TonB family protein